MASAPPASVPDAAGDVSVSPAGAALQARPKQEAHTLAALERLLAELETTHLPATRQAGDAMLEKVYVPPHSSSLYALLNDGNASDALDDLDSKLEALQTFLRDKGLAGIPLSAAATSPSELRAQTRNTFEQRARLSDASALVFSILRADE